MKKDASYRPRLTTRRMWRRTVSAFVLIVFFLVGYNSMTANTQSCSAQYSVTPPIPGSPLQPVLPSPCGCAGVNTVPCSIPGSTALLASGVEAAYYSALSASAVAVENYISMSVDTLVQTVFSRLEQAEQDITDWFDTYWYYNYKPSLQAMTEQANVAGMDQAQQVAAVTDAEQQNRASLEIQAADARSAIGQSDTAGEEACAVATSAGSFGTANTFSRAMRRAWQNDSNGVALNRSGTASARGATAAVAVHAQEFENLFCNPNDNGGANVCGASDPQFYNADTQVTGRIYNALTIPVDKDERHLMAVEHMVDNMMGRPRTTPVSPSAIKTSSGKQNWIERRPYAARKNAARAVLNLVAGWRIPGGAASDGANCTGEDTAAADATGAPSAAAAAPTGGAPAAGSRGPAILAMGTNGGSNVQGETQQMIRRLQDAGYSVVVVPPRQGGWTSGTSQLHDQVVAAARATGAQVVEASSWANDGYHIAESEARAIGQRYRGAPTFGDSNSVRINAGTGGTSSGVVGASTQQILRAQFPSTSGTPAAAAASAAPGSCSFVAALRQGAGVPLEDLSDNPSYREILHAMSIDRFNSGAYAIDKIGTAERQQMEKVVLNAMYLMQLRDYYELLERTALTLAVQVSVLSDEYPLPAPVENRR